MPLSAVRQVTADYSAIESWGYDRFVGESAARQMLPTLRSLLDGLPADGRLLDVGCGGGHLLVEIADDRPTLDLSGVDLCPRQVGRARSRTERFGRRVNIDQASALELPHGAASFDAVLSVTSVKHWPDQEKGLSELLRVLRPGGTLHVVEVFAGCSLEEVRGFLATLPVPKLLHPVMAPQMRKLLQTGWTVDDAQRLARTLGLGAAEVTQTSLPPTVTLAAIKPS